jgi:chromosomal replication initiator protein
VPTTSSPDPVCARIASRLAESVGEKRYSMWFGRSAKLDYCNVNNRLEVKVPSRFVADWINRHFEQDLRRAASHEVGEAVELSVEISPERFEAATAAIQVARAHPPAPVRQPLASASGARSLRHRLEDFIVGPSNELAYATACRLAEDENAGTHPLFIHGGCGLGKTHLLQGICSRLRLSNPVARVHYTTGEQFTNEFLASMRANKLDTFRRKIRGLYLLAVDDVHFIANKQATQQEFLHSFEAMDLGGARVVLASDSHPKQIRQFSEALISRCMRGLVVQIDRPDKATRIKIIRHLAQRRGLRIMDSAIDLIAAKSVGSIREIEGLLTKLHAMATLMPSGGSAAQPSGPGPGAIGHLLVERVFSEQAPQTTRRVIRMQEILAAVIEHSGATREQILSNSRHRHSVLVRSAAIYLARKLTSMSFPEIAAALGRDSHSSIVTAAQRIEKQLAQNLQIDLPNQERLPLAEWVERVKLAIR